MNDPNVTLLDPFWRGHKALTPQASPTVEEGLLRLLVGKVRGIG